MKNGTMGIVGNDHGRVDSVPVGWFERVFVDVYAFFIGCIIGGALCLWSASAFATITPTYGTWYCGTSCSATGHASCGSLATAVGAGYTCGADLGAACVAGRQCKWIYNTSSVIVARGDVNLTCPANSTLSSDRTTCVCNSGYTESGGACGVPSCPTGQTATYTKHTSWNTSTGKVEVSGGMLPASTVSVVISGQSCVATWDGSPSSIQNCYYYVSSPQKSYCDFTVTTTGATASSQPASETPNTSNPCPASFAVGVVNGISNCYPSGAGTATGLPPTPVDSSKTSTSSTSGDVTTTVTTINNGGSVTTITSTVNNATGAKTESVSTKGIEDKGKAGNTDQAQFCRDNPNSPLCKVSSFSGSCGAFVCDGDSVQCAIAKEQHTRNCAMYDTDDDRSILGKAAMVNDDPLKGDFPNAAGNLTTTGIGSISQATWLAGGGTCPVVDKVVSFGTWSLTLPFSNLCSVLTAMGYIVVAFSMLAAARIVGVF